MQLLSGTYLFSDPNGSPTGYFLALTIALGILFVVSAIVYWRRSKLIPHNPILRRVFRRLAKAGMSACAVGLFLALMRYIEFPFLDAPILMLLLIFGMILIVGYFVYDLSEHYPLAIHRLRESHLHRQFRPVAKVRSEPQRPRPKVRGKRRR